MRNWNNLLYYRCAWRRTCRAVCLTLVIAQMLVPELRAQMVPDYQPKITGVPPVVQRVAKSLWLRARMYLETGSPTFYAIGVRAQDTSQIMKQFAPTQRVNPRTSQAIANALRRAARQEFARETQAVGIMFDSITTNASEAMPNAARFAVSEIHTTDGLCVRIVTPYRLLPRDDAPDRQSVGYGEASQSECEWQNYWKDFIDLSARVAAARTPPAALTTQVVNRCVSFPMFPTTLTPSSSVNSPEHSRCSRIRLSLCWTRSPSTIPRDRHRSRLNWNR